MSVKRTDSLGKRSVVELAVQAQPATTLRAPQPPPPGGNGIELVTAPGQSANALIGMAAPLTVEPFHFYRVRVQLRRTAHTNIALFARPLPTGEETQVLPPGDFLVAPVWEETVGFFISPDNVRQISLRFECRNQKDGLPEATAGLGTIELTDAGAMVPLKKPRRATSWDRLELGKTLATLPHFPNQGAGVYRITAKVKAATDATVQLFLAQGDDDRLHWHRTSEYGATAAVKTGDGQYTWTYLVPDRRFTHQWIRGLVQQGPDTVVIEDLVLEQLLAEPPAAASLGLQAPKNR